MSQPSNNSGARHGLANRSRSICARWASSITPERLFWLECFLREWDWWSELAPSCEGATLKHLAGRAGFFPRYFAATSRDQSDPSLAPDPADDIFQYLGQKIHALFRHNGAFFQVVIGACGDKHIAVSFRKSADHH